MTRLVWQQTAGLTQRLVDADTCEVLAEVRRIYGGDWKYGVRSFTNVEAAKTAAERDHSGGVQS